MKENSAAGLAVCRFHLAFACYVDYLLGEEVRSKFYGAESGFGYWYSLFHFDTQFLAESVEIFEGKEVYVWRVVPCKWKLLSYRRYTTEEQLGSALPVGKIGEADNYLFADAQQF